MKDNKFLTNKWLDIRKLYESNTNGFKEYGENFEIDGELDQKIQHFLGYIGKLTLAKGYDAKVENVKLDIWKERIWTLIENAGLLPNIAWRDELDDDDDDIVEGDKIHWDDDDFDFILKNYSEFAC
jgi:hypothetical protein